MSAAERSTILLRSGKPFKNRWNRGGIGISIWKQRIFGMRLQREKILCAPSGRKSIIALISNSSGCVYGKRRITGSHYEERSMLVLIAEPSFTFTRRRARRSGPTSFQFGVGRFSHRDEALSHHRCEPRNWPRDCRETGRSRC